MLVSPRFLALAALAPALCLANIAVSPVKIEKTISPKDNTVELVVANPGDAPVEISLSAAPLVHDREGRPMEGKPGYRYDASGLIHFEQPSFTLGPRRWKRVRAHVDVPSRPGGAYAFIYVKGLDAGASGPGIRSALRVGVVTELTFPDPGKPALEVQGLVSHGNDVAVAVRNDGPAHVRPAGTVVLKDRRGQPIWSAPVVPENIFPGLVRELKVSGAPRSLAAGDYAAEVVLTSPAPATLDTSVAVRDGKLVFGNAPTKLSQR